MNETEIQKAIVAYLSYALPGSYRAIHINNTPRNAIHGRTLKAMGLVTGVPDIAIVRNGGAVAFLEVKTPSGRLSNSQVEWRDWCGENSVPHAVVRGTGDVEAALLDWGVPIKSRVAA